MKRKYYLDNVRWIIVLLVVLFHVVDVFNSTGVNIHYNAPGIPAFDLFGYFVYPWFMGCLFAVAGMSAKYSLEKRTDREYIRQRTKTLLIPFVAYNIIFSVITSAFCFDTMGGWQDFALVPKPILYFIMVSIGMGHTWFLLELYIISAVQILIKKLDKKNRLDNIKFNIITLVLMAIPLWASAQILNFLGVFRNLYFLVVFLLGYYIFTKENILSSLKKYRLYLLGAGVVLFFVQAYLYAGLNGSKGLGFSGSVNKPFAVLYGWIMILAVIGNGQVWFDFSNRFTKYMSKMSFGIYLFHYLPMIIIAYFVTAYMNVPVVLDYLLTLVFSCVATMLICEAFRRIPGINKLFALKK